MIFTDDHPPPHVHVVGRGQAKIEIGDPQVVVTEKNLSKADIARARDAVGQNREMLLQSWDSIHG